MIGGQAGNSGSPAQVAVELPVGEEPADLLDPQVSRAVEVVRGESDPSIRIEELFDAAAHRPFGAEIRKPLDDLRAVDAIAAWIGTAARRIADSAVRHHLVHDGRHLPNSIVLISVTDI